MQNAFSLEKEEKQIYIDKLKEHSLIVYKDKNNIETSDEHNLKPLLNYLDKGDFDDTYVFDKTVGRAAAWLYVYGDADYVYADTISKPAIKILKDNDIEVEYKTVKKEIENKAKTDICPFEKLTKDIKNPTQAYGEIYHKTYPDTSIVYYTDDIEEDDVIKL